MANFMAVPNMKPIIHYQTRVLVISKEIHFDRKTMAFKAFFIHCFIPSSSLSLSRAIWLFNLKPCEKAWFSGEKSLKNRA